MVSVDRLNRLLASAVNGTDPGPLTAEEQVAFDEIKAQVDANPDVTFFPQS